MTGRDERNKLTSRRLILSLIAAVAIAASGTALWRGAIFRDIRERAYPLPSGQCRKTGDCDERALHVQNREAQTADAAFDVALFQLALSLLGLGGLGFTVYYARQAWKEAEKSASAAHSALAHMREESLAQDERFAAQAKIAARNAAAAEESARGSVDSAQAAQKTAHIMEQTARRQLQAYLHADSALINWFDQGAEAVIKVVNCGVTPATFFEIVGVMDFQMIGAAAPAPVSDDRPGVVWAGLGGGGETTAPLRGKEVDPDRLDPAQSNYLSVRGFIRYGTIFHETFESEFSFMLRHRLGKDANKLQRAAGRLRVYRQV